MKRQAGKEEFPIWLLGDSAPENWKDVLEFPFDARHPIRHNIWTSVLDVIQNEVFMGLENRVDSSSLYIRNAIVDAIDKPKGTEMQWSSPVIIDEIKGFQTLLSNFKPALILSFGAFAFEFARRSLGEKPERKYHYWGAKALGEEFIQRIDNFSVGQVTLIPLLHRSIAGGKFVESHKYFVGGNTGENYFDFVGKKLSEVMIQNRHHLRIWLKSNSA